MLFNSYIFILLFLPLCLSLYFGLNHKSHYRLGQVVLLLMSLWFYGYFNPRYLIIIVASILLNYGAVYLMGRTRNCVYRRIEVIIAIMANLGILFYYKYFDFFLLSINKVLKTYFPLHNILLPLGISFFTFQQISYVIDAYRGGWVAQYDFLQYASFVTYFPQLIAGPIVTHDELIPQFVDAERKHFRWENFSAGLYMFAMGLGKKVLIADIFGIAANWGFDNVDALDSTNAIFASLAYTIQIYFDFSGYCDMAIGIAKMMNLDLPINFDSPYKSLTITEFWDRWHKTLTRFFTRYIYIPLGGSRRGTWCTYRNMMIVFLVSGIWHGANYTFILWGILHGIFSVVTRWKKTWFENLHPAFSWLLTFSFVNMAWVLFRADSVTSALRFLKSMWGMRFGAISAGITSAFALPELMFVLRKIPGLDFLLNNPALLTCIFYIGAMTLILCGKNAYEHMQSFQLDFRTSLITATLLIWSIMSFSGVSTFLYFNF